MTMMQAIETCLRKYANFSGRAARSEYWYWNLFNMITVMALVVIDESLNPGEQVGLFSVVTGLVTIGLYLPTVAVYVRRLHDVDRSGWWMFIGLTGVGMIPLFYWTCIQGTQGPNRFGADPLTFAPVPKARLRLAAA